MLIGLTDQAMLNAPQSRFSELASRTTLSVILLAGLFCFGAFMAVLLNANMLVAVVFYGAVIGILIVWNQPYVGLLLLLAVIPLQYLGKITDDGSITVAKLIMPVVVLIWVARALVARDKGLIESAFRHPVFICALIFILATMPSFINARRLDYAYGFMFLKIVPYLIIAVMMADMVRSKASLTWLYKTVFGISFIVGAFGIFEFITGESILHVFGMEYNLISGTGSALVTTKGSILVEEEGEWYRVASTFLDPDFFGGFILLSLGFALGLWWLVDSIIWRLAIIVYLAMSAINIVGTGSRAVLLSALALGTLFVIGVRFRFRASLLILTVVGSLILIPNVAELFPQFRQGVSSDAFYADPRYGFWTTGLAMIKAHPVIGVGLGNFVVAYPRFRTPPALHKSYLAHNVLIGIFAETGIIGGLFFCILGVSIFLTLLRTLRETEDRIIHRLTLMILISFTSFSLFALTSNTLDFEYAWVVIGLTVVLASLASVRDQKMTGWTNSKHPASGQDLKKVA